MLPFRLALCILLFLTNPALGSAQKIADRIYYGGEIITVDDAKPIAQAVAIRDGRIIGVGELAEIVRLRGAETELHDLDGRTLAPGFIDAYGHLSRNGFQAISANLLRPPRGRSRSIAGIKWTLSKWKKECRWARTFGLVLGFGYDESQFTDKRRLTRRDLDAVSRELPVIAIHRSGKKSVFNTPALELAGFDSTAMGGTDGILEGTAHTLALQRVLGKLTEKNVTTLIDAAQQLYIRFGHTTAQDSAPGPAVMKAYSKIAELGRLRIDVIAYPDPDWGADPAFLPGPLHPQNYVNGFRIGGVVLRFADRPRPRAARPSAPWLRKTSGPPAGTDGSDPSRDAAILAAAIRNGWQVIGRPRTARAADRFLAAMHSAAPAAGSEARPAVLIHDRKAGPGWLRFLHKSGIEVAVLAPATSGNKRKDGGKAPGTAAIDTLINQGVPFTASHGAPSAPPDMLRVMAAMIREAEGGGSAGRGPARMAALKAVTLWAARQYGEEKAKGSITAGKLADLTILSANPLTANPKALTKIRVEETIKEGEAVFVRGKDDGQPPLACANSPKCFSGLTSALRRAGTAPPG